MAGESNLELESILLEIKAGRAEPRPLPFEFFKNITGDFSDDQMLGEGGFGKVYKVKIYFLSFRYITRNMSVLTNTE